MYRPARFVANVRVVTFKDVNIEELAEGESDRAPTAAPIARGALGEARLVAAWYETRATRCSTATGAAAKASSISSLGRGRVDRVLRGEERGGDRVRHARSKRSRATKQRRLRRLAALWLAEHPGAGAALRFDVASVSGHDRRRDRGRVLATPVARSSQHGCASGAGPRARASGSPRVAGPGRSCVATRAAVGLHRLVRLHCGSRRRRRARRRRSCVQRNAQTTRATARDERKARPRDLDDAGRPPAGGTG